MNKFSYLLFLVLFVSCQNGKKNLEDASKSLCKCFENYDLNLGSSLRKVKACNDSIIASEVLEDIPKEKLFKQLQQDCPDTYHIIKDGFKSQ